VLSNVDARIEANSTRFRQDEFDECRNFNRRGRPRCTARRARFVVVNARV
jgi:hypothetical protein